MVLAGACPFPTAQGSQVYLRGMARALAEADCDVTVVVYGHGDEPHPNERDGDARDDPYRVVRTPRLPGYRRVRSGPDLVKPVLDLALAARIAACGADVVVAHNLEALAAALLARSRTGVPVVYAAHTLFGEELATYLPSGLSWAAPAVAAAGAFADRTLAPRADLTLALSPAGQRALRALGCRVALHPPGLDPRDFAGVVPRRPGGERDSSAAPDARPVVVYAGNVDGYQDLPLLAAVAARAPDLRVLVVGPDPGPPPLEHVRATGWEDVAPWLAGADVAVVPRARCAGLPVKVGNALALGVPVVVSEACVQRVPGEVAFVPGDATSLLAAIRAAAEAPRPDPPSVLAARGWPAAAERLRRELVGVVSGARSSPVVTGAGAVTFPPTTRRSLP